MNWGEAASRLESIVDFSRISSQVARRLASVDPLFVACSGGADSVFVLLFVFVFRKRIGVLGNLSVLHFDHALRGPESDGDAVFVRELAGALQLPFFSEKAIWGSGEAKVSEDKARRARVAFFRRATGSSTDCPVWIATGHHGDDVTETFLMRLSRGAGLEGLAAPREISDAGGGISLVRPILDFGREEIRSSLKEAGIPWREDASNFSDANYRARLRKEAIPAWENAADRPLRRGVGRSRRLLLEDCEAFEIWTDTVWREAWDEDEKALLRAEVDALPQALQRRILTRLPGGETAAASVLELALEALQRGDEFRAELRLGIYYQFCSNWLRVCEAVEKASEANWPAFPLPVGTVAYLPDGYKVAFTRVAVDEDFVVSLASGSNADRRSVHLRELGNPSARLTVRRRQAGDAFKPHGKSSRKKLKNLFIDRKINRIERESLPVFVCDSSGIVWVPGIPPNADRMLGIGSEAALRLTYER